jgi:hypothetical protein
MSSNELAIMVKKLNTYALGMSGRVSRGGFTSADAVSNVILVAANMTNDRSTFAKAIGNVLVNNGNWPSEIAFLRKGIAVGTPGSHFVPFNNSGFCRLLRDSSTSDEGNLPHHMLSYFVMAHFLPAAEVYVGVSMHEQDTLDSRGTNPEMAGDLASGTLGVKLANKTYSLKTFPSVFSRYTKMKECGHQGCK